MSDDDGINDAVCIECIHYKGGFPPKCEAFPDRIPDEIWFRGDPHIKNFIGDNGITFERII